MILVSILVFLCFWATSPARAAASDCEVFMYGSLCSTDRLSDIIWVIPHLENEIKCQVWVYILLRGWPPLPPRQQWSEFGLPPWAPPAPFCNMWTCHHLLDTPFVSKCFDKDFLFIGHWPIVRLKLAPIVCPLSTFMVLINSICWTNFWPPRRVGTAPSSH